MVEKPQPGDCLLKYVVFPGVGPYNGIPFDRPAHQNKNILPSYGHVYAEAWCSTHFLRGEALNPLPIGNS